MMAGRCTASITLAMVKVLPEPVTPSSTWSCSRPLMPFDQLGDRGGLVAGRLVVGDELELLAALGLRRPRRPVRRPGGRDRAGATSWTKRAETSSTPEDGTERGMNGKVGWKRETIQVCVYGAGDSPRGRLSAGRSGDEQRLYEGSQEPLSDSGVV